MQEYYNTERRKGKHLTYAERNQILAMVRMGTKQKEIAERIGVSARTIRREIKRGMVEGLLRSDLRKYNEYSPEKAQELYEEKQRKKQGNLKIAQNIKLSQYIEDGIINKKYSPYVALENAKRDGIEVNICLRTLYNYIDKELFIELTRKDLPYHKKGRYKSKKIAKKIKKLGGKSIEIRKKEINDSENAYHWEMDTVVGTRTSKACLLVLTERKTRKQIIRKMESKTSECVIKEIEKLAKQYPKTFKERFRSITVDNGAEFMNAEGIEKIGVGDVYYAHSYCSYERGSNENANKLIRRFIEKGTEIEKYSEKEIRKIERFINNMPRKMFGGQTSEEFYRQEIINIHRKTA